ncbi:hypothetical protein, partial [Ottowia beijingensis]|uniref:hypothetical protein n=1 Tax=Ottowia beijingensis TaxID=1207057 RepID=UPI002FDB81FA
MEHIQAAGFRGFPRRAAQPFAAGPTVGFVLHWPPDHRLPDRFMNTLAWLDRLTAIDTVSRHS